MNKYLGILEPYAKELFMKKNGESVNIPITVISPLLEGQKGGPLDVTRRAFGAYIEKYYGIHRPHAGKPSPMNKFLDFENRDNFVIVTKKSQP